MSTFQAICVALLALGVATLWKIAGTLEEQKRLLGKILDSLCKLYEVRDIIHDLRWMMRSGEYEPPRPPKPPSEMPDLKAIMAQYELDQMGKR